MNDSFASIACMHLKDHFPGTGLEPSFKKSFLETASQEWFFSSISVAVV